VTHAIVKDGPALPVAMKPRLITDSGETRLPLFVVLFIDATRTFLREPSHRARHCAEIYI
jgi:hypothetical protein